jgi:inner membrane protein
MDSISQAVLGASVAGMVAPAGYRRKALLLGACLGTLPDVDVFIDYGDAVRNFTYHRLAAYSRVAVSMASGDSACVAHPSSPRRSHCLRHAIAMAVGGRADNVGNHIYS